MGDGVGQLRAVESVEVEFVDAIGLQDAHLFGCHNAGDYAAMIRIVFGPVEHVAKPGRNCRSAHC